MRSMLGTGHAMAVQNNVDDVYYNTLFRRRSGLRRSTDVRTVARQQREAACGTGVRAHAQTARAGLTLRTAGDFRPKGEDAAAALGHYRDFERKGGGKKVYTIVVSY